MYNVYMYLEQYMEAWLDEYEIHTITHDLSK